jgi:hypothetical protein
VGEPAQGRAAALHARRRAPIASTVIPGSPTC